MPAVALPGTAKSSPLGREHAASGRERASDPPALARRDPLSRRARPRQPDHVTCVAAPAR